jgi:hypothetical protein
LQKRLAPRSRILSLQEEELREQAAAMWSTTEAPFSLTFFAQRKKHLNCDVIISCASSSSSCACSIIIIIIIIIIMLLQIPAEFED